VAAIAAGHIDHTLLQSDGAEIYQLLTQPEEYLNLCQQPKPPWLSILTKIDTKVAEGVHRHGEEIKNAQLIMKLQLRRPYSELTIEICMHMLHLTTRGREAGLHSFYRSTRRPFLQAPGIPHNNKKDELSGAVRELMILQTQGYGLIYHGFVLICCFHATLLPDCGRQMELQSPWDPGGATTTCKQ
jgi:hypothetical protein